MAKRSAVPILCSPLRAPSPAARRERAGLREVYRVLKPGGRLLLVDIDRPTNPLWWLLCRPLLFFHFTAPNLRGEVPAYLRAAGFAPVEVCARKGGVLSFWLATKPVNTIGGNE